MSVLERNGETYAPQYLTDLEFEEIVNSPMEHGLLDADGEPINCGGGGGGGQEPGPQKHKRHKHNQQSGHHTEIGGI